MVAKPELLDFNAPGFAQAVLEAAPLIVLVLDVDGRVVHYNGFMERLCGRPLAEARGCDWFEEFVLADERDVVRDFFHASIEGRCIDTNVNYVRVRDGEPRLIEWYDRKLQHGAQAGPVVLAIGVDITERVREANERAELAQRFELFANRVDEAFFVTNGDRDRVLYLSPAFERITGVAPAQIYADADALAELFHPEDRHRFMQVFGSRPDPASPESPESPDAAEQIEREYRIFPLVPGGDPGARELRWVWVRYSLVPSPDGQDSRIVGTITDITDRKRAAQEVEELGRIFALFDGAVDEVFLLLSPSRDRLLYASQSAQRVFGANREAAYADIGVLLDRVHPDDRERLTRTIGEAIPLDGHGISSEYRVFSATGELRWVVSRLRALGRNSPMPGAIVSISMDISARHEAEQRLHRLTEELEARVEERTRSAELERERLRDSLAELEINEARLAGAQRIAEVGDWDWDIPTSTLRWSDEIHRIFERPIDGTPVSYDEFLAMIHEDDRGPVMAAVDHALETGEHYEIEHRIVRPNGEIRCILENGEVTCDERGRPIRMQGTAQDITRQKRVEAELRASLSEKDALLHEIHHRVKNNLQVVSSLLYLQGANADHEIRAVLDECRARIRSMALIHEQLYVSGELSRIEMHQFLAKLGEDIGQIYASDGAIDIRVLGNGLLLEIERAIPVALVANELLTNALKYAYPDPSNPANRANHEVRVKVSADAIEVEDDGVGLPPDFDESTSGSLGLRLVRSLARQVNAQLEFTSTGPGTRVRLQLCPILTQP